jgi:hypothetical protein
LGFWDERNDLLRMSARYNMRIKNWRKMGRRRRSLIFSIFWKKGKEY